MYKVFSCPVKYNKPIFRFSIGHSMSDVLDIIKGTNNYPVGIEEMEWTWAKIWEYLLKSRLFGIAFNDSGNKLNSLCYPVKMAGSKVPAYFSLRQNTLEGMLCRIKKNRGPRSDLYNFMMLDIRRVDSVIIFHYGLKLEVFQKNNIDISSTEELNI